MLLNIQALRALAALLVVVVHLEGLGAPLGLRQEFFDPFAVGVDLFFVISGFIMVHTTSRHPIAPGVFLLNRLARIAPLYWLLTLGVFLIALGRPAMLGGTQADWDALWRSLAFIPHERADGTLRPVLFVGWSLNLEMAFYCLFALALTVRGTGARVAVGVGLLLLAVALGVTMGSGMAPELRFLTQPILLEFGVGMIMGWLYPRLPSNPEVALVAAIVGLAALPLLIVVAQWPVPGGWPATALPAGVVVMAALVAERGGLTIGTRWLPALGDASYALYLSHPFVTQAWTVAARAADLTMPWVAPLLMAGAFLSAIVLGMMVHERIERPMGRWVRRRMGGGHAPRAAAFGASR